MSYMWSYSERNMNQKILLAVVAHPDDESFGMGGTLAHYAQLGVEVHLICATRGEAGAVPEKMLEDGSSIGELRQRELCCAADMLGLKKVHFLGYRDSGMPGSRDNNHPNALVQAPIEEVAKKVLAIMKEIKPQVVVTFDPIGGYMHPDHIAVHQAAVLAFNQAREKTNSEGNQNAYRPNKLYFHIFPRGFLKWTVSIMRLLGKDPSRWGNNGDINLTAILAAEFPTHAKINYRKVAKKREQASACHVSQGGDKQSGYFVTWLMRLFSSYESFMRAYPKPENNQIERDLFEGVMTSR